MFNCKTKIILLMVEFNIFEINAKPELDLSNYAIKADSKKHKRCWYIEIC